MLVNVHIYTYSFILVVVFGLYVALLILGVTNYYGFTAYLQGGAKFLSELTEKVYTGLLCFDENDDAASPLFI